MRYLCSLVLIFVMLHTQAQHRVVADKIVGIVGDKVILKSDIINAVLDLKRQQGAGELPPNAECLLFDQQLSMKALVLQAEKDSLVIPDEEIEALLDNQVRHFIGMYGSKEALEEIAGRTVYQIKDDLRKSFREKKMAEQMRDKIVEGVKITPQEVKEYFEKIPKDSLRFYEAEFEIGEIVVYPKASRDLETLAMDELQDFREQVLSKRQRFETLARLYTDDPGSKESGGQYAINRTEKNWDPAFIQHAFRLREGEVSPVFKSKFGYHIIQMVSRAGDDAVVRHILRIPRVTQTEIDAAINKLDSVRALLISGQITFGDAVARFSEDDNSKFTGGMLQCSAGNFCTIDQLGKDLVLMLDKMKVGEFSQPTPYKDQSEKSGVRIVFLKGKTEPHIENLKDDYNKVATRALEEKKYEALQKWFSDNISRYYLMVDASSFGNCTGILDRWLLYASNKKN